MPLAIIQDGPLLLNPVSTYLSGPLTLNYVSANAVAFPTLKAKLVSLTSGTRVVKMESVATVAELATGKFLFQRVTDLNLKIRLSSLQIEDFARAQVSVWLELVRTSSDPDIEDEPVCLQEINFSGAGLAYDATPGPIQFNVNGTTMSVIFSLTGSIGNTETDFLAAYATARGTI